MSYLHKDQNIYGENRHVTVDIPNTCGGIGSSQAGPGRIKGGKMQTTEDTSKTGSTMSPNKDRYPGTGGNLTTYCQMERGNPPAVSTPRALARRAVCFISWARWRALWLHQTAVHGSRRWLRNGSQLGHRRRLGLEVAGDGPDSEVVFIQEFELGPDVAGFIPAQASRWAPMTAVSGPSWLQRGASLATFSRGRSVRWPVNRGVRAGQSESFTSVGVE